MDTPDAIVVLRAPRLLAEGFVHGFSTRHGGVSVGPYASLNLGYTVGDEPDAVTENHRRHATAVGYARERLFETCQVHGAEVYIPQADDRPADARAREADALVARNPDMAVGVRVADCVPVLLGDRATGHVAAVHAGWRGLVRGVLRAAVRALGARDIESVVAAVGPSIGPCCFEVGDEVAAELAETSGDGIVLRRGDHRPHVDLWRGVEHQLRGVGITAIDTLGRCTVCDHASFYSFRRDGAKSGRMLGVIAAR
jgi:YfiH family protein